MSTPNINLFALHQQLCLLGLGRSPKTFGQWRKVCGVQSFAKVCSRLQAEMLIACAVMRSQSPTVTLTKIGVLRFLNQNRDLIAGYLSGVPRIKPQLEQGAEYPLEDVRVFIRDCSECGAFPSVPTIRRWVISMGLTFSESHPIPASVVYRLIDRADDEAKARVKRGQQLGKRMKSA